MVLCSAFKPVNSTLNNTANVSNDLLCSPKSRSLPSSESDNAILLSSDETDPTTPTEPEFIVVNPETSPDSAPTTRPTSPAIVGRRGGDRLTGTAHSDKIRGKGGNDTLLGYGGDDRLNGGRGNDRAKGANGDDVLRGAGGHDILKGGRGNDQILGLNGNDRLIGGRGDDVLEGGKGRNIAVGKRGDDRFVLHRRGTCIIRDYQDGSDRIDLPNSVRFGALTFNPNARSTEIEFRNQILAILRGVDADALTSADFI